MNFQKSIGFTMNGFFKFLKQLSEDVDIFKISKSWIQNLKNFKILKISKIMFFVFLGGFGMIFFDRFFRTFFRSKIFKQLQLYIDTTIYWGHEPSSRSRGGLGT